MKSLQKFNKEKLEELGINISHLANCDIELIESFLSTALAEQAKMIEAEVVPRKRSPIENEIERGLMNQIDNSYEARDTGYNQCLRDIRYNFKELNK